MLQMYRCISMTTLVSRILALGLGSVLLLAQAVRAEEPVKPTPPAAATETNKTAKAGSESSPIGNDFLNVGDRVKIVYADTINPIPPQEAQIPDSGELTLHLNHKFMFKGKRRDALEQEIVDYYVSNQIYRIIHVTIEVPPRPISVGGEVHSPGNYPHNGNLTVLKVIDMAGGFTEFSKKTKVVVIRNGKTFTVDCKKALKDPEKYDKAVFPGDKIQVERSIW
jgi:polysaccharide export outer membrane protein